MLSIEASSNTGAAVKYFRANLSMNDYYSEKEQVIGQWHGKAAQRLNLQGDVKSEDFEALLKNRLPNTDEKEKLTAKDSANRRAMYDFTFTPVKSVSVVHSITKDQGIIDAHQEAVKKTMLEVEKNIQTQVGTQGVGKGKHYVQTGNMVYAEFLHDTTRPTLQELKSGKNYVPDPLIHSHCATPNATFYDGQNKWRAIEIYGVKKQAPYYEALYHAHLGQLLLDRGYELYRTKGRWEINGVPRNVIEKYSNRTKEIEAKAEKEEITDPNYKAKLGRITRHDKNKSVDEKDLPKIWRDRLTLSEYHAIVNAKKGGDDNKNNGVPKPVISPDFLKEKKKEIEHNYDYKRTPDFTARNAVDKSLLHYFERNSGIEKKRVLAYAINLTSDKISPEEVKQNLESRSNIITATNKKGIEFITTHSMHQQEEYLIERAAEGRAIKPALNPSYEINNDLLNQGQKAAVNHALNSHDEIILISGDAGTGKTTLLKEIQKGLKESNKELHAFAPSSDAARNVLRSNGFENADTISMLLANKKLQERTKNGVIVIDEGGLVGVPTMNRILNIAQEQNARLLISGDWKQHSAVEAGDAQKLLETRSGLKTLRVKEIMRQREAQAYKQIVARMANGIGLKNLQKRKEEMGKSFQELDKGGNIIEIKNQKQRHQKIADDYLKYTKKSDDDAIVVSPTRKEGKILTDTIRENLREAERIGKKDKVFYPLESKQFTGAEKQIFTNYKESEVVEFHQNVKGFKAGQRYTVTGHDGENNVLVKASGQSEAQILPFNHHKEFNVYTQEEIKFARHDLLRITKNTKSMEGVSLSNGQTYSVKTFDWNGDIKLSNGATLSKNAKHLAHGYVTTSPSSQGKSAKTVLVAQQSKSGGAAYDKQFYTSVSRGSENCKIYTDNKEILKESVTNSHDGMSASEIVEKQKNISDSKVQQQTYQESMQKIEYANSIRDFYETRFKPTHDNIKTNYEKQISPRELAEPER